MWLGQCCHEVLALLFSVLIPLGEFGLVCGFGWIRAERGVLVLLQDAVRHSYSRHLGRKWPLFLHWLFRIEFLLQMIYSKQVVDAVNTGPARLTLSLFNFLKDEELRGTNLSLLQLSHTCFPGTSWNQQLTGIFRTLQYIWHSTLLASVYGKFTKNGMKRSWLDFLLNLPLL